jgi:hypothetical protein
MPACPTAGDRLGRWPGRRPVAVIAAGGYGGYAAGRKPQLASALATTDTKDAILEAMPTLPSAVAAM